MIGLISDFWGEWGGLVGEIPSFRLFESERVFAFLDIQPLSRGHAVCMVLFTYLVFFCFSLSFVEEREGVYCLVCLQQNEESRVGWSKLCASRVGGFIFSF